MVELTRIELAAPRSARQRPLAPFLSGGRTAPPDPPTVDGSIHAEWAKALPCKKELVELNGIEPSTS